VTIFFNGLPLFAPGHFDRSSRFGNSYNPNPGPGDTLFLRRVVREIAFKGPKSLGSLFVRAVIAIEVVGGALSDEAALVMMLPMFIGADAASTAGGIKVATFLVTMLATISCSYRESAQPITRAGASIWGELLLSINVRLMMPISRSRRGTALRKHAI